MIPLLSITSVLQSWSELGIYSTMAALIGGQIIMGLAAIQLVAKQIVPLAKNHLEHIQTTFDRLSVNYEGNTDLLRAMKDVHAAQAAAMELHNDLTAELLKQLRARSKEYGGA